MRSWMLGLTVMVTLLAACGGTVDTTSVGGSGGGGTGGAGATGGAGGSVGGSGGAGGDDGTCSAGKPCSGGAVCFYGPDSCDPASVGSCQNAFSCDGPPSGPVCQCDGTVLEGEMAECTLWSNSAPFAAPELCATGTFACGPTVCTRNVEVCVITYPGLPNGTIGHDCAALAEIQGTCAHGIADCSCLDATSLGCSGASCCSADADHQETISIYLP